MLCWRAAAASSPGVSRSRRRLRSISCAVVDQDRSARPSSTFRSPATRKLTYETSTESSVTVQITSSMPVTE